MKSPVLCLFSTAFNHRHHINSVRSGRSGTAMGPACDGIPFNGLFDSKKVRYFIRIPSYSIPSKQITKTWDVGVLRI